MEWTGGRSVFWAVNGVADARGERIRGPLRASATLLSGAGATRLDLATYGKDGFECLAWCIFDVLASIALIIFLGGLRLRHIKETSE